ncbi:MAG: iron-containing alcohol dehydrogenase [Candidatus Pelagibacterales bacterium]|mgnify:FL=1|jgi:alcohol dehydrogenase class IV|tara:strand:+ start:11271 stop:12470 length:1200 start_codon:yes stop_codon:yes gene_type:complete
MNTKHIFNLDEIEALKPQDWTFPVPIAYGPGRLSEIGIFCKSLNIKKPLIVTDSGSKELPFIESLKCVLVESNIDSDLFFDISPNPRDNEIVNGCSKFKLGNHDAIIAIGGGSAMDGGKAICLTANNDIPLWDFEWEKPATKIGKDNQFPKLITIPTTAGTGAETESTAMVTHLEKKMKFCITHPELKPSLALLDPELTLQLPASLTAWTGADAMIHAIEGYCVPGFNPLCDGAALESLSLISKSLYLALEEPDNLAARGAMLVASCLGGIAFIKGLGLVHAIAHMVGAEYNTHHGLTNAIILPTILRFNLPNMEEKVKRMAEAMQLGDHSVDSFILNIEKILDRINIPKSLHEIGIPEDCASRIAKKAMADSAFATNPRTATLDEVYELVVTCINKSR